MPGWVNKGLNIPTDFKTSTWQNQCVRQILTRAFRPYWTSFEKIFGSLGQSCKPPEARYSRARLGHRFRHCNIHR